MKNKNKDACENKDGEKRARNRRGECASERERNARLGFALIELIKSAGEEFARAAASN